MYVCMHVCMYACMYACVYEFTMYVCVSIYGCIYLYIPVLAKSRTALIGNASMFVPMSNPFFRC